jgi:molecular chaperone IbpA
MAVAGFAEAELNTTQKENKLLVSCHAQEKDYLYRSIARPRFQTTLPARAQRAITQQ